ncbi:MAG: hypothetical protein ABWZ64_15135 [Xanthobacteraceae bacterium]
MSTSPFTLHVFLSSPGDVAEERKIARDVMAALEGGHLLKGKVRFEIVAWDDGYAAAPMDARETPQVSVNRYTGRPSECDLTLVILWSRLGTPLPPGLTRADGTPYQSGTVWEYEDALAADKPVYIYRRTAKPRIDLDDPELDDKRAQYEAVKRFFGAFTNRDRSLQSGLNSYADSAAFRGLLRQHLEAFVQERLGAMVQLATPVVMPDDPRVLEIVATLTGELQRKNREIDEHAAENAALRGRVQELEDQLQSAIARTLTAAAQPDASPAAIAAADALEAGNTGPAEALLRSQEREEAAQIASPDVDEAQQRRQAAALAREQGALAMGHDVRAALAAYQRAATHEPDNAWTHFVIGDLHVRLGDLSAAIESYLRGAAAEARLGATEDDVVTKHHLGASYDRIGSVLERQGDVAGALAAHRKALAIAEELAARDPSNTEWQCGRLVSHLNIGDVHFRQVDRLGALAAYRTGLAVAQALAARDPGSTQWRYLSVSHNKIGDVLKTQGNGLGALSEYCKGLGITEALAACDPARAEWQNDLSISYNKIGDVLMDQNKCSEALAEYCKGFAIAQALAARDPANMGWQRDLSASHSKIGNVLKAQGDGLRALAAYRKGLAIAEALTDRDPTNAEWQTDAATLYAKLGLVECHQDVEARRNYLLRGRDILAKLKEAGRLMPNQDWIGWFDEQLGQLPADKQ